MALAIIILLPLIGALLPALFHQRRDWSAWIAGGITFAALLVLITQMPAVFAGEVLLGGVQWLPRYGLNLTFRLDGLGLLFAVLILGIGLLIVLYANYYLSEAEPIPRFYSFLLLFMSAMLGIVLTENLLLMLVFWELTSLSSFLLIGYWKHRPDARQGARMALAITGGGGLALLGGILLLGHIVGSYELSAVLAAGDQIKSHPLYLPTLILVLGGAMTKSAQFPFHFWLPHAMAAPTPVSAYLHSATMVKAGIFLMARLFPALAGTDPWFYIVSTMGLITLVFAAYVALLQHDLKGLLAYSTLSHLGLITLLLGMGTPLSEVAAVFHIINHATFKASLFMAAGIIDHECGTRDMRRINGLIKYMPYTAALAMVSAAAMAGVPLLNGFLSKEMFFTETLMVSQAPVYHWVLPVFATLGGVFSVAYSIRFIHDVFFNGEPIDLPRKPHEPPRWMKIPVEILTTLCLVVGTVPALIVGPLLAVAAAAVLGPIPLPEYSLHIWHGFNLPLIMSMIASICGILVYVSRHFFFRLHERHPLPEGKRAFERLLAALVALCDRLTRMLENGSLQRYLALLVIATLVPAGWALWTGGALTGAVSLQPLDGLSLAVALILAVAALGTAMLHRRRLTAIILLSVVGLIVALIFVHFSAPDLALTQLSVEMVSIVLLLLALYFLPQQSPAESSVARRWRDGLLAGLSGLGVAALCWGVLTRPYDTIADYFLANSVPGGGGTNVVNVILVDFRGYDTLGEITVLGIAALGIFAMLKGLRLPHPARDPQGRPWSGDPHPLLLSIIARPALPLMLLMAVYIFLRGHNLPGGGFIAGLIAALAMVLQFLANGVDWTRRRLPLDYARVIGIGLLIAVLTGLASGVVGYPFLTSAFTHVHWPVVGEFELASAIAFDLGVFLTVVGVVLLIIHHLGSTASLPTKSAKEKA
jgi:multicomponent K+:H+ antiporter subunit A